MSTGPTGPHRIRIIIGDTVTMCVNLVQHCDGCKCLSRRSCRTFHMLTIWSSNVIKIKTHGPSGRLVPSFWPTVGRPAGTGPERSDVFQSEADSNSFTSRLTQVGQKRCVHHCDSSNIRSIRASQLSCRQRMFWKLQTHPERSTFIFIYLLQSLTWRWLKVFFSKKEKSRR